MFKCIFGIGSIVPKDIQLDFWMIITRLLIQAHFLEAIVFLINPYY